MATDNTRTSIELELEIARNLDRAVSSTTTTAALSTRDILNDAMLQIARKFKWSFLHGTDKISVAASTTLSQITGYWRSINNVCLVQSGSIIPLKPMLPERIALYMSGYSAENTVVADNIVTTTGQPIEYLVIPADANIAGAATTNIKWLLFYYPQTDAAYTIRFEGERYYPYLPYTFYDTGTITITDTDDDVVGTGTTWTDDHVGKYMWISTDTTSKRIISRSSATALKLASTHAAVAGATYAIKDQENYMTKTAPDLLVAWSTMLGFQQLGEPKKVLEWKSYSDELLRDNKNVNIMGNKQYGRALGYRVGSRRLAHGL